MSKCKSEKKWPIGQKTLRKKLLSIGDKVLFYEAGDEGKKLFGSGDLFSSLEKDVEDNSEFVTISSFEFWNPPIPIKRILSKLSFIKNKKYWGIYFQGGIVRLPETDYSLILNLHKKR